MTADALLAIVLNVAIPFALALAGGILAAKALPRDSQRERAWWVCVFVGLFVFGIVLAFVQQVRLTSEQRVSEEKAAATELRMTGDAKFTQGQLDSINKVLTALVEGGSNSKSVADILKALQAASRSANNPNAELKQEILDLLNGTQDWIEGNQRIYLPSGEDKEPRLTEEKEKDFHRLFDARIRAVLDKLVGRGLQEQSRRAGRILKGSPYGMAMNEFRMGLKEAAGLL